MDKSDREWLNEPDELVWINESTGYQCALVRRGDGAWGGFVGVQNNHDFWGTDIRDIYNNLANNLESGFDTHGGVYSTSTEIPETKAGLPIGLWWFGIHFSHFYDFSPGVDLLTDWANGSLKYRNLEYAKQEVDYLAEQLHGFE